MKKTSKTKIISTYALALYQAAVEKKKVEQVLKDVDVLKQIIADDPQTFNLFANRVWGEVSKKEAIAQIAKKLNLCDEIKSCLDIMIDNNRMKEFQEVLEEFKHLYYQQNNIEEVEVMTVQNLSASQDKKLKTLLEKKLAKKVLVKYTIKPELLGGLVIKYGSSMMDDSIKGKLNRLEIIMKGEQ